MRDGLRACLASLRSGRARPAYLEVPLDLLAEQTDLTAERFGPPTPLASPSTRQVTAAVDLLVGAKKPLIVAGGGARGAGPEVRLMAELLDGYVVTTAAGKGVLPDNHAANLGTSLPFAETQSLAAAADVIVAVGTELGETDLYTGFQLRRGGKMIRIDLDPAKLADHYAAEVLGSMATRGPPSRRSSADSPKAPAGAAPWAQRRRHPGADRSHFQSGQ